MKAFMKYSINVVSNLNIRIIIEYDLIIPRRLNLIPDAIAIPIKLVIMEQKHVDRKVFSLLLFYTEFKWQSRHQAQYSFNGKRILGLKFLWARNYFIIPKCDQLGKIRVTIHKRKKRYEFSMNISSALERHGAGHIPGRQKPSQMTNVCVLTFNYPVVFFFISKRKAILTAVWNIKLFYPVRKVDDNAMGIVQKRWNGDVYFTLKCSR